MRHMTRLAAIRFATAIALLMTPGLIGCSNGNARTVITEAPAAPMHFKTLKLEEDRAGAPVPDAARAAFREKLEHRLYNTGSFIRGDELKMRYNFMEYDPGSQVGRLLFGVTNSDSEANIIVQCTFVGPDGKDLSKVEITARLTGGLLVLGGSSEVVLDRAAEKVRDYAVANFGSGI